MTAHSKAIVCAFFNSIRFLFNSQDISPVGRRHNTPRFTDSSHHQISFNFTLKTKSLITNF
ncbi:CLUMA_CG018782, isoform A [Clunio marinus]|uniref:CLUMA_CG018782, isoform A n=1 Tax=Clunio marinus TaxID=568069 RepID=A0A1J1J4F6_9DIPT|nr:CLUMA_CG018782, isoform A [Clunio marinus]